jgi:hypothetical protein
MEGILFLLGPDGVDRRQDSVLRKEWWAIQDLNL